MKHMTHILLCLLSAFSVVPAAKAQEVLFTTHWQDHEYQPYRLEHQEYTRDGNDTLSFESFSFVCDVLIEDSLPKHYSLSWRMHDFSLQTDHYLSRQWFQSLYEFRLDYTTDKIGVLERLLNADEFDRALDESVDAFFRTYPGETLLADRERLYALRDNLERFVLSSVQQYHQAYGLAYRLGEVLEMPAEVELGSTVQPAKVYKKLEAADTQTATLVTATVLDSIPGQENTGAWMMHLPSGWVVCSYDNREINNQGEYSEIRLLE